LLGATHRAFTFYLGNPISSILGFLDSCFLDSKTLRELRMLCREIDIVSAWPTKPGRRGDRFPIRDIRE
jgi:hypothetical protein